MYEVIDVSPDNLGELKPFIAFDVFYKCMTHAYQNAIVLAACFLNEPVGVIIADRKGKGSSAELCYLFVRKKYRRLGIASLLLQSLEDRLIDQDCQWLTVRYIKDENSLPLKQWLERSGFSSEATDMHIFRGSLLPEYRNLPFIRMSQLPKSFTIFPWRTLSDTERDQLRKGENQWYPDYLSPFKEAYKVDMKTSVGLRYRSEVVGWLITHKTPVHALEYAKLFTRREFQSFGRGIALIGKAMTAQLKHFQPVPDVYFRVSVHNKRMLQFIEKRILPHVDLACSKRCQARKKLA